MRVYDAAFTNALNAAQDGAIAPARFFWVVARRRDNGLEAAAGFWTGDEDISLAVEAPAGGTVTRTYIGGCNLSIEDITYTIDLTDQSIQVSLSQLAPAVSELVREHDPRLAYCEIHETSWNKGVLFSVPQLAWVGIIDEGPIETPAVGGQGSVGLTIRSELMTQLGAINPAKSSDQHQRRRNATDEFSKYASTAHTRNVQWIKRG